MEEDKGTLRGTLASTVYRARGGGATGDTWPPVTRSVTDCAASKIIEHQQLMKEKYLGKMINNFGFS